ncbi:MAG: hypothetical protein JNL11_00535 [Bdellovibrionaceae bacterium]|nr:hypothetical protein [Pseudobdellovibrionaceae bacterium]
MTTMALAQMQQSEMVVTPLSEQELTRLIQQLPKEPDNSSVVCVLALLKGKTASQVSKVKEGEYSEYLALEGNIQDWTNAPDRCHVDEAYYEILVNAKNQHGQNLYRMRNVSYIYTADGVTEFHFYTPYMSQAGMNAMIESLRSHKDFKTIDMGSIKGTMSFKKLTVTAAGGQELVVASLEDRLAARTKQCSEQAKGDEVMCDDLSYSIELGWIYNNFLSFNVVEGIQTAKYLGAEKKIVAIGKSKIEPIQDIRSIFPETSLLASLKQDWIIRNSNKWTRFSKANTWNQFWNFSDTKYYGNISEFQSYSNRIDAQQAAKVVECARLAGKNPSTNSGFSCVQSKRGPSIYMFNYRVYESALQSGFDVFRMDAQSTYVRIYLASDSTGSAVLQMALPRKSSDYFKVLAPEL